MKRTPVVLLASGVLVAAITGTALASGGDDDVSPSRSASSATASSAPSAGAPAASPSGPASWSSEPPSGPAATSPTTVDSRRAGRIALAHVGGGTVTKVESEVEHGRAVWNVRIVRNGARYDLHVDRNSGEITRSRSGSDDDGTADDHRGGDDGDSGRHGRHHG